MRFKIGDLVKSKEHPELLGCVLNDLPDATFAKVHWFHPETQKPVLYNPCYPLKSDHDPVYNPCYPLKSDLEKVNESR